MDAPPAELGLRPEALLAPLTTLAIGGRGRWLLELRDPGLLDTAWGWARRQGLPVLFLGAGSNVLFADAGYEGLVVRNRLRGRERAGNEVRVSGGEDLGETIRWVNGLGLAGMERLYGIPGTLAGAVVGNAGAYGQEIGNRIREVSLWSPKEGVRTLPASDLDFRYRHSLFKERRGLVHALLHLGSGAGFRAAAAGLGRDPGHPPGQVPGRAEMPGKLLQERDREGAGSGGSEQDSHGFHLLREDSGREAPWTRWAPGGGGSEAP